MASVCSLNKSVNAHSKDSLLCPQTHTLSLTVALTHKHTHGCKQTHANTQTQNSAVGHRASVSHHLYFWSSSYEMLVYFSGDLPHGSITSWQRGSGEPTAVLLDLHLFSVTKTVNTVKVNVEKIHISLWVQKCCDGSATRINSTR